MNHHVGSLNHLGDPNFKDDPKRHPLQRLDQFWREFWARQWGNNSWRVVWCFFFFETHRHPRVANCEKPKLAGVFKTILALSCNDQKLIFGPPPRIVQQRKETWDPRSPLTRQGKNLVNKPDVEPVQCAWCWGIVALRASKIVDCCHECAGM